MHVVHVYDGHERVYDGRGSVPDVVWNLAKETAKQGHDVTVVERQWADLPATAKHEGVSFQRLGLHTGSDKPWDQIPYEMISSTVGALTLLVDRTNFALAALRKLGGLDSDVVHVHLPFAANVLATVAPWLRKRMVYTAHLGETESRVTEPRFSPDVYLAKRVARTIALNPTIEQAFAERGVQSDQLVIVPNGVDIGRFEDVEPELKQQIRSDYSLDYDRIVLFVGTVTPRKGVEDLIRAVETVVADDRRDVGFVIVGRTDLEPDYVSRIRDRVTAAEIANHVTFTGFVSEAELRAFYAVADIFALPSYEEGSSIAVSEAIAAGLPVVGSAIDGIVQQIDHGTHGLLADPGDIEQLASHLGTLLDYAERRETMAEAVADRAQDLSWERVTERMLTVYEEVDRA